MKTLRNTALAAGLSAVTFALAGTPDQPLRLHLQAYPNPCTEHLTITLPTGFTGHVRAEVRDGEGRPVISWPFGTGGTPGTQVTLDTNDLPQGSYVLYLLDEVGDVASTPFFES